jgi:hypothetical protein
MPDKFGLMARRLGQINVEVRHLVKKAEAKVEQVNALVRELAKTGLLKKVTILGKQSRCVNYADGECAQSCFVVLPVLLTPEGIGICIWDSEHAIEIKMAGMPKSEARRVFTPFAKCAPADKAFLMRFIEPLLEDLMDLASVAAGDCVKGADIPAHEYFEMRRRKAH